MSPFAELTGAHEARKGVPVASLRHITVTSDGKEESASDMRVKLAQALSQIPGDTGCRYTLTVLLRYNENNFPPRQAE